jgi:hypothetical protein
MTEALSAAGFIIDVISEPRPLPEARERFPADYQRLSTQPQFLFFAVHRSDGR